MHYLKELYINMHKLSIKYLYLSCLKNTTKNNYRFTIKCLCNKIRGVTLTSFEGARAW